MKHYNIPIFVPHSGCPHDCSFCNQKSITGKIKEDTPAETRNFIESCLSTMKAGADIEIAFFGGSFTGIEIERQKSLLSVAESYKTAGKVNGIRLSTRPDYISKPILDMLDSYGVTAVELGVQSMDDEVLQLNNRGHTAWQVKESAALIRRYNFELGLQMMTGLYGSTPEKDIETAERIAELAPDIVRIYPTMVLEDTYLHRLYKNGRYIPQNLEQSVDVCAEIYKIFTGKGIKILRIGLQSTDIVCEKGKIAAGAYHSAFGELVQSRVIRRELEKKIKPGEAKLVVEAPKSMISKIVGNKKENVIYFKNKYNVDLEVNYEHS